ncbi:MAG TPA: TetR/AcrR family transcriptional regulator [Geminicoccaceae bacterium]
MSSVLHLAASPKHDMISEAARRVFLRDGYRASMDLVAAEAGVSKQTVYNHFGNKEGLFRAIIEACSEEFLTVLVEREPGLSDPARTLSQFGERFLALVLDPESLALHRMLVTEAPRFPDLAEAVYRAGPGQAVRRLAGYFEQQDRRGTLAVPDPVLSAEQFLGALTGHVHFRALLGVAEPSAGEIALTVRHAVGSFLRAHARS